jgi:hypothetical protein
MAWSTTAFPRRWSGLLFLAWLPVETTLSDLTPEKPLDALMDSLQRMAMKVIEAPTSEREAVYELMEESLVETAQELRMDDGLREQYMTWLRAMVSIIESGGGAPGGTA